MEVFGCASFSFVIIKTYEKIIKLYSAYGELQIEAVLKCLYLP